jgi:tetratricopeptide (TPR) repeat protein
MAIPTEWPVKPGLNILITLNSTSRLQFGAERQYSSALRTLADGDTRAALEQLRSAVTRDRAWHYSQAWLLVLLLSGQLGDLETVETLAQRCELITTVDRVAREQVRASLLKVFTQPVEGEEEAIGLPLPLHHPALAVQLGLTGCLLAAGRRADATVALARAWELYEAGAKPEAWGIEGELAVLYTEVNDLDRVLDLASQSHHYWPRREFVKADALGKKGLTDAALIAWDAAIREEEGTQWGGGGARYFKASFLLDIGDHARARRELAQLYARFPTFDDQMGLLNRVESVGRSQVSREPIPEQVRHAVWRRDDGRCVQCGSQENLEYDHIIPLSRGGANTERNLQLLCERCNRSKGATV